MDYYNDLKMRNDILSVAFDLGYNGKKSGSCHQGDCPEHGSTGGICLVIWPSIQGFKCYICGKKGDVINIVMLYKRLDHKGARDWLADRAGMAHLNEKHLSPEDLAKRESEVKERVLVEDILTEATHWYHEQLSKYPDILNHLLTHYKFSQEIIDQLQIGFAPPPRQDNPRSELAQHLSSIPEFKENLALSGLFTFGDPSGPLYDYFKGRIIFPYWKGGKVVYMTGRSTSLTPIDIYECYTTKDGQIKNGSDENPEFIKYKKLRNHDPTDEKKKFISKFIQNDIFMGEDIVRGAKEVIITEGAPDWVSAVDKGFFTVSPVTTRFREQDYEKLAQLTAGAENIYIINDNEVNQAGYEGALQTGKFLTKTGKNVYLVLLPRPLNKDKIDLNEYFLSHTPDDLRELMKPARSCMEILISDLPHDFLKAQPTLKTEITPLLIELDDSRIEHFKGVILKRVKTTRKVLDSEIKAAREEKHLREAEKGEETLKIDPEIQKEAQSIAMDPLLLKKRIDAVNEMGVVGERGVIAMYLSALDSRLLPEDPVSPNVLAIKNAGHFGSGKSYTLETSLQIYPKSAYYQMTNGSAKSIFFLKGGLKHKALIVTEGFQFQTNNAPDSELVYSIRSLISEGRLSYCVVEKNEKGVLTTIEKKLEGPTSFITTTVMESLEAQFEDRLFTIHPDESVEQTKAVLTRIAEQRDGSFKGLDQKTLDTWIAFHESLKPVNVIIPFSKAIVDFLNKNKTVPIATRRAAKRVMTVIQTIACAYQNQRTRDSQGRVIAEISDYWMALQIVQDAFKENVGAQDKKTEKYLKVIKEEEMITPRALAKKFGVKHVSGWTTKNVSTGIVEWCQENGSPWINEEDLKKAKKSGEAYLRVSTKYSAETITGLPTPYDLTNDPQWELDGELLHQYDLRLENKAEDCKVENASEADSSDADIRVAQSYGISSGLSEISF